jgi:hypothetical protein
VIKSISSDIAPRGKDMGLNEIKERPDGGADVANLVGERLAGQIDPLAAKAPALTIEWLVPENLSRTIVATCDGIDDRLQI